MTPEKVLVVDDEAEVCEFLSKLFGSEGFDVITARGGGDALKIAKKDECAVAIVDLNMPGLSGMKLIHKMKKANPDLEVIVYTGYPSLESSVEAIHEHVFDYICKPAESRILLRVARRAAEHRRLILENRDLVLQLKTNSDRLQNQVNVTKRALEHHIEESPEFVGKSEPMRQVRRCIAEVAPTDMNVLLLGESGTGKNVVANLIHESSGRDLNAFVRINCPSIPETLLESELFGHEAGAFTGAEKCKPGRLELASGGTVLLDEIGDLPPNVQAKLLQVLEQKQFNRLGGNETIKLNVRIIAATNAPIEKRVESGQFRADLYYRLNEYAIELPPLRERIEDISLTVKHFLSLYSSRHNRTVRGVSSKTLSLLSDCNWPGNVRELETVIRRYVLSGDERIIRKLLKLPELKRASGSKAKKGMPSSKNNNSKSASEILRDTEIQTILKILSEVNWNQKMAAGALRMSYSSLRRRISKYGLKDRAKPPWLRSQNRADP